MKKESIKAIHFIKAICAIGIIVYHFNCYRQDASILPLHNFANGSWGSVFVTVFFIVSGMLLYYNYEDDINVKRYFINRWKSIYPMFYIAYLSFFIGKLFEYGTPFWKGHKYSYIFTLLGFDGYFYSNTTTYYIIGEWFLGAIIILYILFPIIRLAFKKNSIITFAITVLLYISFVDKAIVNPFPFRSIISCMFSFVCGMMMIKYKKYILNVKVYIVASVFCVVISFIKMEILRNTGNHIMGIVLFIVVFVLGEIIMNKKYIGNFFVEISKNSYAIFLLQNIAISKVTKTWNPSEIHMILIMLLGTVVLTLCEAKILTFVTNWIMENICKLKKSKVMNK